MCDLQEKESKRGKTSSSKSQHARHHRHNHGHRHHHYHHKSCDNVQDFHAAGDKVFSDHHSNHQIQCDNDKTHPLHRHHSNHHKPKPRSLSETSPGSTSTSSLTSSSSSSSSSPSSSSSSSSSSFSSSSTSSSTSSLLSSVNSSECSDRHVLQKPRHSQSCTDISGKHRYFEEGDDTVPLINKRGHLNMPSAKQKPSKSSHSGPIKGTSNNKQTVTQNLGNNGSFRKAKSMEALTTPKDKEGSGSDDEKEQERYKTEAKKNMMKEKMKFSAFLNEITRQVLSPMRLTSLGVTDAQRPSSPRQVPASSKETDSSTEKLIQQRSRTTSADSISSGKHSYTSRHSHSSGCSHSKSSHRNDHHSPNPRDHGHHRPRTCHSWSPTREHHSRLPFRKHHHHHHHPTANHPRNHHEDCNRPSHRHHHRHHRSTAYQHRDQYSPTYYNQDHQNPSHCQHCGDHQSPTHHHSEHQSETYSHDQHGHGHERHHVACHAHHHDGDQNPVHEGHRISPYHHEESHSSGHNKNNVTNSRPTTPHHHGHPSPTSDHEDHHSPTHQHHHGDGHKEPHQHHHGDHTSGPHHLHHRGPHSPNYHHHHGDQYTEAHQHHPRDQNSPTYEHHTQHHHKESQHHHGDHHENHHGPGDPHHHGDLKNEPHGHHHRDHHSPGQHHHHGEHHNEAQQHPHGEHHGEVHHHHHHHHHRGHHSLGHHHHHVEKQKSGHHHHGDPQNPSHHHYKDHHSEVHQHHHGNHHNPGHHHHHGDHHNEPHQDYHGSHHREAHHHHYGDHHSEAYQNHHEDHHNETDHTDQHHHKRCHGSGHQHHHGEYYNTSHHQDHHPESQPHHDHGKDSNLDHESLDGHHTFVMGHSATSPLLHGTSESLVSNQDSPRNIHSPSSQNEEQTSFTGQSSHKENAHDLGRIMIVQDQKEGLHQSLLKTAVRVECLGEEFISSQKLLETELQKTRMELSDLMEKFKRLHETCSSTQQTNNLLEQKLQTVAENMEGERVRLNRRISELTEQLTDAKIASSMGVLNVTSVLHKTNIHSQTDGAIIKMVPTITPPPAEFMDSQSYGQDKASVQEQPLGSVPEEEESDWSEVGEETPRLILTGSNRGQVWRLQEVDMDKDSESGGEDVVRPHFPRPLQIPHLQFTVHNDFTPPSHTNSCASGFKNLSDSIPGEESYRITKSPNLGSILIRSASLEEIPLAHHHMQKELRGTEAMMDLHHSGDEAIEVLDNEIIHHWRMSNTRDTVIRGMADSSLSSLQSAEQMLNHLLSDLPSSQGREPGVAEVHGWSAGIPKEVLRGERTQL